MVLHYFFHRAAHVYVNAIKQSHIGNQLCTFVKFFRIGTPNLSHQFGISCFEQLTFCFVHNQSGSHKFPPFFIAKPIGGGKLSKHHMQRIRFRDRTNHLSEDSISHILHRCQGNNWLLERLPEIQHIYNLFIYYLQFDLIFAKQISRTK